MRALILILPFLCCGLATASDTQPHHEEMLVHAMGEDRIVVGPRAQASGAVAGDLIVAGGEVFVSEAVGGDVIAAGGNVRIEGETGQDLYAGGGSVTLGAPVKHNARIAGGEVETGRRAPIEGNATIAGGRVTVLGNVRGQLAVAGGNVYLNSQVGGNVEASGGEIELGPDARIAGDLHYQSPAELKRDPGAEVLGAIVREPPSAASAERAKVGLRMAGIVLAVWTAGLMVVAALYVIALPRFSAALVDLARARPGMSTLLGFAVLFATPAMVGLLLASAIGLPLGLLLLAGYLVTLMLGQVSAGVVLGQLGLQRLSPSRAGKIGWRSLAASLGLLLTSLLGTIPLLGWLAWFIAWLAGIGLFLLALRSAAWAPTPQGR